MNSWNQWLEALTDKAFFNLYKNYRGSISTPYNKQELIRNFSNWLKQDEVQNKIIQRLSKTDCFILSIVHYELLPTPDRLTYYLTPGEIKHIENLKERLLILPMADEGGTLGINPLLKENLQKKNILNLNNIIDCKASETTEKWVPDNAFLVAFFTFIHSQGKMLLNQGEVSKKIKQDFIESFNLSASKDPNLLFDILLDGLTNMGLLVKERDRFVLAEISLLESFAKDSINIKRDQLLSRSMEGPTSKAILSMISFLLENPSIAISGSSLKTLLKLCGSTTEIFDDVEWQVILNKFEALGLLVKKDEYFQYNAKWHSTSLNTTPPIIQPNGDILLAEDCDFIWPMVFTCNFQQYGSLSQFHIDKTSFQRGTPYQLRGDLWINCFQHYLGYPLDNNLKTMIQEWDKHLYSIELEYPVMVTIQEEHRSLVERTQALDPYTIDRTSTGAWILPMESKEKWLTALENIGIHYVAPQKRYSRDYEVLKETGTQAWSKEKLLPPEPQIGQVAFDEELTKDLHDFDPLISKELLSRINRGVILFPWQIRDDIMKGELRQIGGFDYNGKIRMIDMALEPPLDRLEFRIPTDDFEMRDFVVLPIAIENRGPQATLKANDLEENEEVIIPIRKIAQLQRFPQRLI